jgi:Ca-activated chloride channel homolog
MSIESTDQRLTAHALGQLEGEDLEELEEELAGDELGQQELDAIRHAAALLERELSQPSGLRLGGHHLQRISDALGEPEAQRAPKPTRNRRFWVGLSLAAALPLVGAAFLSFKVAERGGGAHPISISVRESDDESAAELPAALGYAAKAPAASAAPLELVPGETDPLPMLGYRSPPSRERYEEVEDNPFIRAERDPRSTFSIDVDTASYALVRRFLNNGQRPPRGAVRIEELVNYFTYAYPEPRPGEPFSLTADVAAAPWAPDHRLLRVGLKARHIARGARPASNLVFLIDVSGSMDQPNKLPLVKQGLTMLARQLDARDHVSIVVYAGASGLVLPPTSGSDRSDILDSLDRLQAGGSTNGGEGIQLAYATAARHFVAGGVNRVILATDGDFNVGITSQNDLIDLIQRKAQSGIFLSVLGFGDGNYQDATLEKLADKGNGNYAYIDSSEEAHKVLVQQASGTLVAVAKDVKLQLEFNPRAVESFRLIGYENRVLQHRDFNDDRKDAGEIGADHTVTALYEIVPTEGGAPGSPPARLRYQPSQHSGDVDSELLHINLRYKLPNEDASQLIGLPVVDRVKPMSADFRFAAAVAELGMLLRSSPHKGTSSYEDVLTLAEPSLGSGPDRAARSEFIDLVRQARSVTSRGR